MPKSKCLILPLRPVPILPKRPCANYLAYRRELEAIDEILHQSGLDRLVLEEILKERRQQAEDDKAFHRGLDRFINHTRSAFRIGILRAHKGCASVRNLEITLADSPLEQWFCFLENFDQILAPGKSTIDRAKDHFSAEVLDKAFAMLLQKAASAPTQYNPVLEGAINLLGFETPVDLLSVWYDATCHCPDIHFPVDWVQLGELPHPAQSNPLHPQTRHQKPHAQRWSQQISSPPQPTPHLPRQRPSPQRQQDPAQENHPKTQALFSTYGPPTPPRPHPPRTP